MDSRLVRTTMPKQLLLKDYLLDDIGSCSSNGFKSFPRRQYCCTAAVRLIHDKHHHKKKYLISNNKPSSSKPSAFLQRVVAAVKRRPIAAAKSPEKKISGGYSFLPRSFSKRSGLIFWRRKPSSDDHDRKEIRRWKSFDQLLKEDAQPSDRSSDRWSGGDLTVSEKCSGGDSYAEVNLNSIQKRNDVVKMVTDNGVGVLNGDVSMDSTTSSADTNSSTTTQQKQWSSDEKEQLSPVSVLDCPFDDEDEVSSSSFQHRLARIEGVKKTLMKKIQRFECLAKLEPVDLATRFALQSDSDNESTSSFTTEDKSMSDIEEQEEEKDENEAEYKALKLLHQMPPNYDNLKLINNAEKLLLDFFRERIGSGQCTSLEEELLEEAQNWTNDKMPRGVFLEWGVQKNRQAYIEDMEKCGEWKTLDQENGDVALELDDEVFDALLNEVLLEFEGGFVVV
ncbi:hypothetical protein ABFX02_01G080700 [Erythranthe guttata]